MKKKPAVGAGASGAGDLNKCEFVIAATHDIIFYLDREYKCTFANKALEDAFSSKKEKLVGLSAMEIVGDDTFKKKFKKLVDQCFKGKKISAEAPLDCWRMGQRHMEISCHPYPAADKSIPEIMVILHDITERVKAENILNERTARYMEYVNLSEDLIVSTNLEGEFTYLNPAAEKVYRYGKNFLPYVHKDDVVRTIEDWEGLVRSGKSIKNLENRVIGFDGQLRYINWVAIPVFVGEKVVGCTSIGRDVTEFRKDEILIRDAGLTFRESEIYRLVIQGYTNLNIAQNLGIQEATVKFYLNRIFHKTGATNRTELASLSKTRQK